MNAPLPADHQFAIGEIVILAVATRDPACIGQEREVNQQPQSHHWVNPDSGRWVHAGCYSLRTPEGVFTQAYPWQLKRKKPPETPVERERACEVTS